MKQGAIGQVRSTKRQTVLLGMALLLASNAGRLRADQVEMQNGDRYAGKVVSLNADTLVIQSDVLGAVRLPRAKVALIALGANTATNPARLAAMTNLPVQLSPPAPTNAAPGPAPEIAAALSQLGAHSNLLQQVQSQFLSGAGPEAKEKFNELLGGLMSGNLSVNDLRAQAQSAADQLRAVKGELGGETGWALDGYLAILNRFLKETAPVGDAVTNAPASSSKTMPGTVLEKE